MYLSMPVPQQTAPISIVHPHQMMQNPPHMLPMPSLMQMQIQGMQVQINEMRAQIKNQEMQAQIDEKQAGMKSDVPIAMAQQCAIRKSKNHKLNGAFMSENTFMSEIPNEFNHQEALASSEVNVKRTAIETPRSRTLSHHLLGKFTPERSRTQEHIAAREMQGDLKFAVRLHRLHRRSASIDQDHRSLYTTCISGKPSGRSSRGMEGRGSKDRGSSSRRRRGGSAERSNGSRSSRTIQELLDDAVYMNSFRDDPSRPTFITRTDRNCGEVLL